MFHKKFYQKNFGDFLYFENVKKFHENFKYFWNNNQIIFNAFQEDNTAYLVYILIALLILIIVMVILVIAYRRLDDSEEMDEILLENTSRSVISLA